MQIDPLVFIVLTLAWYFNFYVMCYTEKRQYFRDPRQILSIILSQFKRIN